MGSMGYQGVLRVYFLSETDVRGYEGVFRVYILSEMAQAEQRSGRVSAPACDLNVTQHHVGDRDPRVGRARQGVRHAVAAQVAISRFRYIACMKYPYRVAGQASALCAGKRASGRMPIQSCGQCVSARRMKRYTGIGLLKAKFEGGS